MGLPTSGIEKKIPARRTKQHNCPGCPPMLSFFKQMLMESESTYFRTRLSHFLEVRLRHILLKHRECKSTMDKAGKCGH